MKQRFRYSLRLALLGFSCVIVYLGSQARDAHYRRVAASVAAKVDGNLRWEPGNQRLAELIGQAYASRVLAAYGTFSKVSDEELAAFARVPELKHVETNRAWGGSLVVTLAIASGMNSTGKNALVTDQGVKHLSKARRLESIVLFNTAVTDRGMKHLERLSQLKFLMIGSPYLTDASIESISRIESLQRFWVSGKISPNGVARLRRALPACEVTTDPNDGSF